MRLIDADELIYESIDSSDTARNEYYYGTGIVAIRKEDIDAAPTIEQPRWIPCSERLPKENGEYFVTDHKGDVARYVFRNTEEGQEYWRRCVKAWMPLPKPYGGDSE